MQKEHTIHINVDIHNEGLHSVAVMKTRIWPPLLAYLQWATFGKPMPRYITDGLGLTIINNLAIIVEGGISDLTEENIKRTGATLTPAIDFDRDTWHKKNNAYNQVFLKKLEDYPCYKSIEVLFWFRNNIAHGRSHSEISKIELGTNQKSIIESENIKYEMIRTYMIDKKMMKKTDTSNNVDFLWKINNAIFLFGEVKVFLKAVIDGNESAFKEGILSEWNTATEG